MENKIFSPLSGKVVSLKEVPDEVFSREMLGPGLAILPENGNIVSPFDGILIQIASTLHSCTFKSDHGIEILLHIGIDTVELNGTGFSFFAKLNQKIKTGDIIGSFDVEFLKSKNYKLHSPVVILNKEFFDVNFTEEKKVKSGQTPIIFYKNII
ncbi:MAG: PTS glucose transporter subunit IIA [Candidatus Improbicoccus pseudotrichonymphae]|uniref:PTS glucose transporter subunit IIA n=1 Tax=Candidatus Improbicoccus pseudotrichonymphae TaxID=3033792 RepID=A0AA48KWW5_9FIRM|nr:MAG: PTS glucose transporter subunit IIA [Candidatus Improbicoccus pseudotrichonymphae]